MKTRIATGICQPNGAVALHITTTKKPHIAVGCFRGGAGGYRPRVQWLTSRMYYKLVLLKSLRHCVAKQTKYAVQQLGSLTTAPQAALRLATR